MKFDRPETSLLDRRIAQGYVCVYCHGWTRRKHNHWHKATQSSRSVQICIPCNAWVGLNPVTNVPLGIVADVKTRDARSKAHDSFDAIWKQGILSRKRAYSWLSKQMGTTPEMTHIGVFDIEACQRVCEISDAFVSENLQDRSKAYNRPLKLSDRSLTNDPIAAIA